MQIGYPADLSASAACLAVAYMDVGMPLLSGTDNGQWLDPAGLYQAEFHRLRRGLGCHSDTFIAVSSLSRDYLISYKNQPTGAWGVQLLQKPATDCLQAIFWLKPRQLLATTDWYIALKLAAISTDFSILTLA
ncbi:MAG: hypothetical protein ACI9W6_000072 [Motiliproteus sp.]